MATTLDSRAGGTRRCASPARLRATVGGEARGLISQADRGLAEAELEYEPTRRFAASYLSALRAAAAILVVHGRPHRARRRPQSVWVLLEAAAPELAEWAGYFAARSDAHAAAQAGRTSRVTVLDAEELLEQARDFLLLARHVIGLARNSGTNSQSTNPKRVA